MEEATRKYAHVLLFQCPQCLEPIASAVSTSGRNLEEVDAGATVCACKCGWSGTFLGIRARQHWVEDWDTESSKNEAFAHKGKGGFTVS